MDTRIKVAVLGYGHLGKWHCDKVEQCAEAELYAIVEKRAEGKLAAKTAHPQAKVVDDIEEVVDAIDAALIVTPTSLHFSLVRDLMIAGKHVFCEKPLCSTIDEAKELLDTHHALLTSKRPKIQVGHSERCHQIWQKLKENELFKIAPASIRLERVAPFKGRATDVDVVQDLMIHDLDLLWYLFQESPVKVKAEGYKIRTKHYDHVTAHFSFASGREATIIAGRNHVQEKRILEVVNKHGLWQVDMFSQKFFFAPSSQFEDGTFVNEDAYPKRDHLLIEQQAFYQAIKNNTAPFVSIEDGAKIVKWIGKVLESIEKQQEILIDD